MGPEKNRCSFPKAGLDETHPHLDDVARGEQPRQEGGVAPVVLAPPLGRRLLHPRHRADDAVDAQRPERAAQGEAGRPALVDRLGLLEPLDPGGDLAGVGPERPLGHLPGEGVECARGDRPGVYVEADGGNMGHGEPPPMRAVRRAPQVDDTQPLFPPSPRPGMPRGGLPLNGFLVSSWAPFDVPSTLKPKPQQVTPHEEGSAIPLLPSGPLRPKPKPTLTQHPMPLM